MYTEEKNIAKEFLKLYANEQVVVDTLADIQDHDYIHSDRWSLVYDMLNENFPAEWRKAATGLVYLVEDRELEDVLNTLNNEPSNKSVADIITDATDRVVSVPDGVSNKEIDM